jgi:hypothetical protein
VSPLSDEERRTFVRWIDLGCPLDFDFQDSNRESRGLGWMADDSRPTLTVTSPEPGRNGPISKIVIGAWDAYTGLNESSLKVLLNIELDGHAKGQNLASLFKQREPGIWEYQLKKPLTSIPDGALRVMIADRQGNFSKIDRVFRVE